jgi:nucleotide-binding universal stress UspA family protein
MTIVVGIDGSPVSQQALAWAIAEGALRRTPVRAVHVWEYATELAPTALELGGPTFASDLVDPGRQQEAAERLLAAAVAEVEGSEGVELRSVEGEPADVLFEQSSEAELLVVGSHGHGALAGALLGSVSQAVTHRAACPVVVVRGK